VKVLVGRAAYLAFGGALALPYAGLAWLFARADGAQGLVLGVLVVLALVGGLGVALLPAVRPLAIAVVRALLGVELPDPGSGPVPRDARWRAAAWFAVTVLAGAVAVLAVLVLLPQAVGFLALPVTGGDLRLGPGPGWTPSGVATLLGPLVGVVAILLTVLVVGGLGAALTRAAPRFLGPTPEEALAAERLRAGRLAWRARLAGELHDHLGHTLTAMTLQAGAAGRVLDADPGAARRALSAIEERGRAAVDELDRVLTLLRDPDGADPGGFGTVADVPTLVEGIRATGREVRLDLVGAPGALARRVVQEGLTNAVRHAGPGPVDVVVRADTAGTVVRVSSPGAAAGTGTRTGRGLAGLRERVEAAGGTLDAGVEDPGREDGGSERWVLRVRLPGVGA
jgi:signal transduction histidine kinase